MHNVYTPNSSFPQQTFLIDNKAKTHHLKNVLRIKEDAPLRLFNGEGDVAYGKVQNISRTGITVLIEKVKSVSISKPRISLACAVPKRHKFETIVEKATELGIDAIYPLQTSHSNVKWNAGNMTRKVERLKAVTVAASEQSFRDTVPTVFSMKSIQEVLEERCAEQIILCSLEETAKPIWRELPEVQPERGVILFIGPEGDFTQEEYALMRSSNALEVSLGTNILKVDTAVIAALACCQAYFKSLSINSATRNESASPEDK